MFLKDTIYKDMKSALKQGDAHTLGVLRMLIAEINTQEIETGKKEQGLSEEEIQSLVLKEIKKRKDSITQYKEGGREESAREEEQEINVLNTYAPQQLSALDIEHAVEECIKNTDATSMQDMGKVMKEVMSTVGNGADGSVVREIVQAKLTDKQ